MLYIFFGIVSAFCFGVSNAYWKIAAKSISYHYLVFFRGIIASVIFGLSWLALRLSGLEANDIINSEAKLGSYLKVIGLCLVCSLGLVFFLKSMRFAPVSITVALSSVNIIGLLTTVFIVGEEFKDVYFFSFTLAIIGILLTQNFNLSGFKQKWNKGATFALLASFFWGITYPLFKFASPAVGALPLSCLLEVSVTAVSVVWILFNTEKDAKAELLSGKKIRHYFVLAGLLIGGTLFFNLAIQQVTVLHLDIIGNLQLIVSLILSTLLHREKVGTKQILGIILILLSIVITQNFN